MADEKRLIDKDKLIENCDAPHWCVWMSEIEGFPEVDAVEVVRCKSCKYWADGVAGCTEHVKCCEIGFYMIGEDGYCSFGERK